MLINDIKKVIFTAYCEPIHIGGYLTCQILSSGHTEQWILFKLAEIGDVLYELY